MPKRMKWNRWMSAALFFSAAGLLLFFGCKKKPAEAALNPGENMHTRIAVQKYEQGDYEAAIVFYEKAIALNPKQSRAYLDLGILQEDYKGNIAKAKECYSEFLERHPKGGLSRMVSGWLARLEEVKTATPVLVATNKPVAAAAEPAPIRVPETPAQTNRQKAEIEALKLQLDMVNKSEEALRLKIKDLEKGDTGKLAEAQKKIETLAEQVAALEGEKKVLAEQTRKKPDESAIQKRESLKFEEEKVAIKRQYEKEAMALKEEIERLKRERGVSEKEWQKQLEQKTQDEKRLKQAFAQATEERARIEKERSVPQQQVSQLQQRVKSLEDERNRYQNQIRQLQKELRESATSPVTEAVPAVTPHPVQPSVSRGRKDYDLVTYHRVKRGETLMMIAGYDHIYADRAKWKIIYEANKDNIDDPNVLVPGQILLVPR